MAPTGGPDAATRARLKEIKLEDVDFDKVKECGDKHVLKRYIQLIEDDGSYFTDLLKACKDKLLQVSPKEYYLLYPVSASENEIDEAMRDLMDWELSVKETDKALLSAKKDRIFDDLPKVNASVPVRGQEPVVARPNLPPKDERRREAKQTTDFYARDKTTMKDYYSAWDKVDVDALEDEFDKEEKELEESRKRHFDDLKNEQEEAQATTEVGPGVAADSVPQAHWKHMADSEKEKGNEAFYSKDYDEAEAYYSRSIQFRADDPSTWANRALVRLKLEKATAALEDCEHSLALNPRYMKALHRKGKALYELKRYEDAVRYFQLALAESPGNTQINGDLMVARRHLRSDGPAPEEKPKPRRVDAEPTCRIEEITDDAPSAPPAAGYTRVQIEEGSDSEDDGDREAPGGIAAAAPAAAPGGRATGGFHKVVIEEVSDSEEDEPPELVPAEPAPWPKSFVAQRPAPVARAPVPREPAARPAQAAPPTVAAAKPQPRTWQKVEIVDESDSEEEAPATATLAQGGSAASTFAPPPRTVPAPPAEPAPVMCFDDMD